MKKVYVVGNRQALVTSLYKGKGWEFTDNMFEADLIQYTGGEDVTPEIYGEANAGLSHNNINRDLYEAGFYALARRLNIPQVGICRGGQFLNVMCGGAMLQDVKGHSRSHGITIADGTELRATSTHHQMMVPGVRGVVLAYTNIVHKKREDDGLDCDPEVIFYFRERCLCFQPHPEYGQFAELSEYYHECLNKFLVM